MEITIAGGEIVEIEKTKSYVSTSKDMLLVYMARDDTRNPPLNVSIVTSQDEPSPQSYLTINELRELVHTFLLTKMPFSHVK